MAISTQPVPGMQGEPDWLRENAPPFESESKAVAVTAQPTPPMMQTGAGVISAEGETASSAAASFAKAMVEARYIIAQHKPRNWLTVGSMLMEACKRPSFASRCEYSLPRWDARAQKEVPITGPTIRFAEEALRCAGNVDIRADVILDDDTKRIVNVSVLDLQSNVNYGRPVVIMKQVQRATLKKGQQAIRQEVNSMGKIVFTVAATESDLLQKQNAEVSKIIRTDGLRLIPFDLREDALMVAASVRQNEAATDPQAVAKRLAFAFYRIGVVAEDLEAYLGKKLSAITAKELDSLQKTHAAISEGEISWADVVEMKRADSVDGTSAKPTAAAGNDALRDRLKKSAPATAAPAPYAAPTRDAGED